MRLQACLDLLRLASLIIKLAAFILCLSNSRCFGSSNALLTFQESLIRSGLLGNAQPIFKQLITHS